MATLKGILAPDSVSRQEPRSPLSAEALKTAAKPAHCAIMIYLARRETFPPRAAGSVRASDAESSRCPVGDEIAGAVTAQMFEADAGGGKNAASVAPGSGMGRAGSSSWRETRSEEHTSELQSPKDIV